MSTRIDSDGTNGGPILIEPNIQPQQKLSWRIMPQNLEDAAVSWKVYQNKFPGPLNNTVVGYNGLINDFQQAADLRSNLARYGIVPTYPLDFAADVKNMRCPKFPGCCRDSCCPNIPHYPFPSVLSESSTCCGFCCRIRRCGKRPR